MDIAEEMPAPTLRVFLASPHGVHDDAPGAVLDDECNVCLPIIESGLLTLIPLD